MSVAGRFAWFLSAIINLKEKRNGKTGKTKRTSGISFPAFDRSHKNRKHGGKFTKKTQSESPGRRLPFFGGFDNEQAGTGIEKTKTVKKKQESKIT